MYIYIYICDHETMCPPGYHHNGGNSCTWVHGVQLHLAGTNEPKNAQQAK